MVDAAKPSRRAAFGGVELASAGGSPFYRVLGFVLLAGVVGLAIVLGPRVPSWWRELHGRDPIYEAAHPPNLAGVDLEAVHHRAFPEWVQLRADELDLVNGTELVASARRTLGESLAADANLTALFTELDTVIHVDGIATPQGQAKALWLTRAWNQYLDQNGAPYLVRADLSEGDQPRMFAFTYEVQGEGTVVVDGSDERVRVLSRLDGYNQWEVDTASEPREGAVVIQDRTVLFATLAVWPLFGDTKLFPQRHRAFADGIVAEAERDLGAEVVAELRATADARVAAMRARADVKDRCSAALRNLPWNGYDAATIERMSSMEGSCALRPAEREAMRAMTEGFAKRPDLQHAVERLVRWLARSSALVEARRVADGHDVRDEEPKVPCPICSGADDNALRAEVSAVLGAWAWSETPAATLFRACHEHARGGTSEHAWLEASSLPIEFLHPEAGRTILEELGHSCSDGPHPDLAAAARALEQSAFDRDEEMSIAAFPERLSLEVSRDRVGGGEE